MLRRIARIGAFHHHAVQRLRQQLLVVAIGAIDGERQRDAGCIGQQAALGAGLGAVRGVGANGLPAERSLGHAPVDGLPFPLDPRCLVVVAKPLLPEGFEDTGLAPLPEAVIDRAGCAQGMRQGLPLATRAQDVENGGGRLAGIHSGSAALGLRLVRR